MIFEPFVVKYSKTMTSGAAVPCTVADRRRASTWHVVALMVVASTTACFRACEAKPVAEAPLNPRVTMVPRPKYAWDGMYAYWRHTDTISLTEWRDNIAPPVPVLLNISTLAATPKDVKTELFHACLDTQAKTLSAHVLRYRSPKLTEVADAVKAELSRRGAKVSVAVFWGRERYVRLLWRYLERNLRVNMGVVDEVLLITKNRDDEAGANGARQVLTTAMETYPGIVKEVPFCPKAYGCAFDDIMTDPAAVYIKLDDDIIFIKDGSFEHLVYQTLFNKDYTFYSGSVVNNPHSYGIHQFAGACARFVRTRLAVELGLVGVSHRRLRCDVRRP
jgi:hypothetical protein